MKNILTTCLVCFFSTLIFAQSDDFYTEQEVTYDRRDGVALTMTVLTPKKQNGKAIISLLSSNFVSNYKWLPGYRERALTIVKHGYTVFLICHRSAPRYAIPDMLEDVQRSVQFVRFHAAKYKVDPKAIGITGTSSGGHLALLAALSTDVIDAASADPIAKMSSRVQAVAVFCPPTDFINYGAPGYNLAEDKKTLAQFDVLGAFNYTQWDTTLHIFKDVVDKTQRLKLDSLVSPVQLVDKTAPPVYIMHGDKDDLVPLQQAKSLEAKLKSNSVPVKLEIKPGAGHGWKGMNDDGKAFNDWFDEYLR